MVPEGLKKALTDDGGRFHILCQNRKPMLKEFGIHRNDIRLNFTFKGYQNKIFKDSYNTSYTFFDCIIYF